MRGALLVAVGATLYSCGAGPGVADGGDGGGGVGGTSGGTAHGGGAGGGTAGGASGGSAGGTSGGTAGGSAGGSAGGATAGGGSAGGAAGGVAGGSGTAGGGEDPIASCSDESPAPDGGALFAPDGGPTGTVSVAQSVYPPSSGYLLYGDAQFYAPGNPGLIDPRCTITQQSGCTVRDCPGGDGGTQPAPDAGPRVGAGTLLITVLDAGVTYSRQSDGTYFGFKLGSPPWWTCGEAITVTASGAAAGVPAFTARLPAPSLTRIAQPVSDGGYFPLTRGDPLPVTWAPATGVMTVQLSSGNYNGHLVNVQCPVPGAAGRFTLPAALTQQLVPGDGRLILGNSNQTGVVAGAWNITVTAVNFPDTVLLLVQ
ncbi:MAG: hypothetical protein IPJ65_03710 [Archangiaceae bacterium]|nr:hypothetical protein [Archangiaceae bacterium]